MERTPNTDTAPTDTKPALYTLCVYIGEITEGKDLVHAFIIIGANLTDEQIKQGDYPAPAFVLEAKNPISFWPAGKTSKDMKTAMGRLTTGQEYRMKQGETGSSWFAPTYKDNVRHWQDIPEARAKVEEWRLRSRADRAENEMLKIMKGKKADEYKRLFIALEPFRKEITASLPNRKAAIIGVVINYLATGSKSE